MQTTVTVPGTAAPWAYASGGQNDSYAIDQSGAGPVVALTGLIAGQQITAKATGTWGDTNSGGYVTAQGTFAGFGDASTPQHYCANEAGDYYDMCLIGCFTDQSGNFIESFMLYDNYTATVPDGAAQLQLGSNSAAFSTAYGSVSVSLSYAAAAAATPTYYSDLVIPQGESQRVNELDGHSSVGSMDPQSVDPTGDLRTLAVTSGVAGSRARLTMGFPGMPLGSFQTMHTMQLTAIDRSPQGMMRFHLADPQRFLMKQAWVNGGPSAWSPGDDTPTQPARTAFTANTQPVSDKNPRYVQGNPIDIILCACQNELGLGQSTTYSPAWKIYTPGDDSTLINPNRYLDVDTALALRDSQFSGYRLEFKLTSAQDGKSWIEDQLLKPLGLYWIVLANGQQKLKSMKQPATQSGSDFALNDDNIIGTPDTERLPIVNVVQVTVGTDDGSQGKVYEFVDETGSADFQQQYESDVSANGFRDAWDASLLSFLLFDRIVRRHGSNTPVYSFTSFLATAKLEVGDFPPITHRLLMDYQSGAIGVSNVSCEIIDRQPDYETQNAGVRLKVADTRAMKFNTVSEIAPLGTPDWSSASTAQRSQYAFISNSSGQNSDGSAGDVAF